MRLAFAALSLSLAGTSAQAAIVTSGTIGGNAGDATSVSLPMFTTPGNYRTYAAFSQPGSFTLTYKVVRTTNLFCDFDDGQGYVPCGGDDVTAGFDLMAGPGAAAATLDYAIVAPHQEVYTPDQFGLVFDHAEGANFEFIFEQDGTVSYRIVTAAVAEPAGWALMIAGFAASGLRLRSRKAALA